jgi:hypothetical protein
MEKEEFKRWYCNRSGITEAFFNEHFVVLPCQCNFDGCEGWAAVSNTPLSIKIHNDLYNH